MRLHLFLPGEHIARRSERVAQFLARCLGGTLVACLPVLILVACLHLLAVGTGVSLPVLLAACLVVGVLHACRWLAGATSAGRRASFVSVSCIEPATPLLPAPSALPPAEEVRVVPLSRPVLPVSFLPGGCSANHLTGTVRRIEYAGTATVITVDVGGQEIVATMSNSELQRLHLRVGTTVLLTVASLELASESRENPNG